MWLFVKCWIFLKSLKLTHGFKLSESEWRSYFIFLSVRVHQQNIFFGNKIVKILIWILYTIILMRAVTDKSVLDVLIYWYDFDVTYLVREFWNRRSTTDCKSFSQSQVIKISHRKHDPVECGSDPCRFFQNRRFGFYFDKATCENKHNVVM